MRHINWVNSSKLEHWAESLAARALLPQLLRRLVHATIGSSSIERANFPSGEGIQRPGVDGLTQITEGNFKVPEGITAWEFGCDKEIKTKADKDFAKREPNSRATFVFVTPRKWTAKDKWIETQRKRGGWRDVRAYDSADLEEWLERAPAVDIWLAHEMGVKPPGVSDLATHWKNLGASIRVPLAPAFVLTDRKEQVEILLKWLRGPPTTLSIEAPSPSEVVDFVAGLIASLDGQEQSEIESRAVMVEDRESWRSLAGSNGRLLLIAGPQLELEPEMIAEAVRQDNHVVLFGTRHHGRQSNSIKLRRMFKSNVHDALRAEGINSVEAQRVSSEMGGSFTILKRLLSRNPGFAVPRWSRGTDAIALAPILLVGAWDDSSTADQEMLEKLACRPYADLLVLANRLRTEADAPVMRVGTRWIVVSRSDSWRLLHSSFTSDLLARFEKLAVEVLSETNPALDLPPEERMFAQFRGKTLKFSHVLREGVGETLGLMGVRNETENVGDARDPCDLAALIVRRLLGSADWWRWASLSVHLPDLAEAAPDEFLLAIEGDLRRAEPEVFKLFDQEGDGFLCGSPHTGLLWALELLAWEPIFLGRASMALARLASRDAGGRLSNRPRNSLRDIFLSWHPQTNASVSDRLKVLTMIVKREPVAGWPLLLALLPKHQDDTSGTYKPRWQHWLGEWTEGVKQRDCDDFELGIADQLVSNMAGNIERCEGLAKHIDELPEPALDRVLAGFRDLASHSIAAQDQLRLWNLLREKASKHRRAQGLKWALPERIVGKLETTVAALLPKRAVDRNSWVFGSYVGLHIGHHSIKHDERQKLVCETRLGALHEVWEESGLDGILEIARHAVAPWEVGVALEQCQLALDAETVLPQLLISDEVPLKQFARGFLGNRFSSLGWEWLESLDLKTWPPDQVVALLIVVPFQAKLWEYAASFGPNIENAFWEQTQVHAARLNEEETFFVVSKLRASHRPYSILEFVNEARQDPVKFSEEFLLGVLEELIFGSEPPTERARDVQMLQHHISELFQYLQGNPRTDESRLARLEWACLGFPSRSGTSPVALHRSLSKSPKFFAEMVSLVYRPKSEWGGPRVDPDEKSRNVAERANRLIKSWHVVPGSLPDGSVDKADLAHWLTEARSECARLDRLVVADIMIGESFARAPADVDGTWPCLAVRDAMEEINSDNMLRGFTTGLFNRRGIISKSLTEGGYQERELAGRYHKQAESIRTEWPMVAAALQRLADQYLSDAKREDEEVDAR